MITIQLTMSGNVQRMAVEQFEIVQHCHYLKCEKEFLTIDPDQMYCVPNHYIYQSKLRRILRESARQTLPTPGCRPVKTSA